jgi:flavin-dependent dehydrogenase
MGGSPDHAFEVRRSEFDQLLFEHSRSSGVLALEELRVTRIAQLPSRGHEVVAVDAAGQQRTWHARFLVDASGRDTFLATKHGWKVRNRKHASAAVFGHFDGVSRRPGDDQGNISIYWFEQGWIWMIPLTSGVMSIGVVCRPEHLKTRSTPLDEFLLDTIRRVPAAWGRMQGAMAREPARATGNFSYQSRVMFGRDYLLVGDAFAFVDPVFSSGVFLAMRGAASSVPLLEAALRGKRVRYWWQQRAHSARMRRGLAQFTWFIYRFNSPAMKELFDKPRNVLQVKQAVISMLAGDVFELGKVRLRLFFFRFLYTVISLKNWRSALRSRNLRLASARSSLD